LVMSVKWELMGVIRDVNLELSGLRSCMRNSA
jgi:hypothetical protein